MITDAMRYADWEAWTRMFDREIRIESKAQLRQYVTERGNFRFGEIREMLEEYNDNGIVYV